ncbi:hypothetical protein [Stieleria varia]|uniref:Uncharacterized protein n=1 Tax=Stieleria varia TaxID=2528005 RepID=A0A5C6AG52_9BACT|nr:hypothetical protein [Stieleria varia]TWT98386.1 hypothetical protein Pla52n_48990 [Stieleria varia]
MRYRLIERMVEQDINMCDTTLDFRRDRHECFLEQNGTDHAVAASDPQLQEPRPGDSSCIPLLRH